LRSPVSLVARDTSPQVELESAGAIGRNRFGKLAAEVSFRDRTMSSACQAGLIKQPQRRHGLALLPLFFAAEGSASRNRAACINLPGDLGSGQLGTGWISDYVGRKSWYVRGCCFSRWRSWNS